MMVVTLFEDQFFDKFCQGRRTWISMASTRLIAVAMNLAIDVSNK